MAKLVVPACYRCLPFQQLIDCFDKVLIVQYNTCYAPIYNYFHSREFTTIVRSKLIFRMITTTKNISKQLINILEFKCLYLQHLGFRGLKEHAMRILQGASQATQWESCKTRVIIPKTVIVTCYFFIPSGYKQFKSKKASISLEFNRYSRISQNHTQRRCTFALLLAFSHNVTMLIYPLTLNTLERYPF